MNEDTQVQDRIISAMEMGNHEQARTLITEYRELNTAGAAQLYVEIIKEYGICL